MCSIYGAIGRPLSNRLMESIAGRARDRGRDGGRMETYRTSRGLSACLGNWRATPTPEVEVGPLQPYDGLVHNGTIANDKALGVEPGEIDSQVLARCLDRTSVTTLAESLRKVKGSYAISCFNGETLLSATNYKPIHFATIDGAVYFSSMARHFQDVLPFGHAPVILQPYTAIDFVTQEIVPLHKIQNQSVAVIASAGLDSTVVATNLVRDGWDVTLLHFTYGCQAGTREYDAIPKIAHALGCKYEYIEIDLAGVLGLRSSTLFKGGKIVGTIEGAEYAYEWVPGRNLVFISLAVAWAEAHGYHAVALGNNLEESGAYPDNEEQFTHLLNQAAPYAVQAHYGMKVLSPVGHLMKHEIVKLGLELGAPFAHTWSCYTGGDIHCGNCGPCFMRREAFRRNGGIDPVFDRKRPDPDEHLRYMEQLNPHMR